MSLRELAKGIRWRWDGTPMETSPREIVLVDDASDDIFFASRLFGQASEGISVKAFDSPVDALKYLSDLSLGATRPAACFVDIRMPQMNGFEVLEWIRTHSDFDTVPVVMLSSSDEPRDVERAKELRADCYLKKFPSVPEMQTVLECVRIYKKPAAGRCIDFALPVNLLSTA